MLEALPDETQGDENHPAMGLVDIMGDLILPGLAALPAGCPPRIEIWILPNGVEGTLDFSIVLGQHMSRKIVKVCRAGTGPSAAAAARLARRGGRELAQQNSSYLLDGAGTVFDISGSRQRLPQFGSLEQDAKALITDSNVLSDDMALILGRELAALGR